VILGQVELAAAELNNRSFGRNAAATRLRNNLVRCLRYRTGRFTGDNYDPMTDERVAAVAFALAMCVALAQVLPALFWESLWGLWVWLWT
jgi:hypothetical protein